MVKAVQIVSNSAKDVEVLTGYCKRMQPELRIIGSCTYDEDMDDQASANRNSNLRIKQGSMCHNPFFLHAGLQIDHQYIWNMAMVKYCQYIYE